MAAERFTVEEVHEHPDFLWEAGEWEYVIQPEGLRMFGWVRVSKQARQQLGDQDRARIVDHLNDLATQEQPRRHMRGATSTDQGP